MKSLVRYSEAFKLQVVRELETGRFGSLLEVSRAYGIRGALTVGKWVRRYGKDHLLGKVVWVMKADEQAEVKVLRQRVRDLEKALVDTHLDLKFEQAYVHLACEAAGIKDVADFKKSTLGCGELCCRPTGSETQCYGFVRMGENESAELLCGAAFASASTGG